MNKVTTINLGGNAYQLEESGYDALRAYLESAAARLQHNPDKDEIVADIEGAIGDKFRARLGPHKTVILTKEVSAIIAEMGPIQDDSDAPPPQSAPGSAGASATSAPRAASTADSASGGPARRLYKIPEGAMLAGVCNGIAAHFDFEVILVRLVFAAAAALFLLFSLVVHWFFLLPIAAYVALAVGLPAANTPEERAAARGDPSTAQEYIRRAKQGYYEGVKRFQGHAGKKHWKRSFKQEMRQHAYGWRHYAQSLDPHFGPQMIAPSFALPLIGLLEFAVVIAAFWSVCLLIKNGTLLGIAPPEGIPLWISIVAVVLAFQIIVWPLKALRNLCYSCATGRRCGVPAAGFLDSLVWLATLIALVWLADHYIPQVHALILTLPEKITHAMTAVQEWWDRGRK